MLLCFALKGREGGREAPCRAEQGAGGEASK